MSRKLEMTYNAGLHVLKEDGRVVFTNSDITVFNAYVSGYAVSRFNGLALSIIPQPLGNILGATESIGSCQ